LAAWFRDFLSSAVSNLLRRINPIVTRVLPYLREKLKPFYGEAKLNVPADVRARELEASAKRIADVKVDFGQRYVVVNIPSASVEADRERGLPCALVPNLASFHMAIAIRFMIRL